MQGEERKIIQQFTVQLKQDVIPIEVLPYLICLTDDDCEQIQSKQDREGPRAAVPTLLDRLKKRKGAFEQFLKALQQTGCEHLSIELQNAMQDQARSSKHEQESTEETKSNIQSKPHKMPITETDGPTKPCSPETKKPIPSHAETSKKPIQSVSSKTSKKKLKRKKYQKPTDRTTRQPELKANTQIKTDTENFQAMQNASSSSLCVKFLKAKTDSTTSISSKKASVSMKGFNSAPVIKANKKNNLTDDPTNSMSNQMQNLDKDFKYDTLICYAKENREIALELTEYLKTQCNIQVCIDLVNFIPGKATSDNISECINSSRSIIFLLSHEFIRKVWAPWELKNAVYSFNESQKSGKEKKIIPVLLKDCSVPEDLKIYTPIQLADFESREECWKSLAVSISGIVDTEEAVTDDLEAADATNNYNSDDCVNIESTDVIDNQDSNAIDNVIDDSCIDDAHNMDANSININSLAKENVENVVYNGDHNQNNHDNDDGNNDTNNNNDTNDDGNNCRNDNHDDHINDGNYVDNDNDHGSDGNCGNEDNNGGNIDNNLGDDNHHTCVNADDNDADDTNDGDSYVQGNDDNDGDPDDNGDDGNNDGDVDDSSLVDNNRDNNAGDIDSSLVDNNCDNNASDIDSSLVDNNLDSCVDCESDLVDSNNSGTDEVGLNSDGNAHHGAENKSVVNNSNKRNNRYGDIDSL